MLSIPGFIAAKKAGTRLSLLTCYDSTMAAILQEAGIDAVLVGDSAAMVMHGQDSTLGATVELMEVHVRAVRAGAKDLCVIADMPFLSTRLGLEAATAAAGRLMVAGANAVKIEGFAGHEDIVPHLVASGIPVMGHLGMTPQSFNVFGGFKVQGSQEAAAERILTDAMAFQEAGAFSMVLECVPAPLAKRITESLSIPTIGIGAGASCDGQILVLQDMLGMTKPPRPRFVRPFADLSAVIRGAVSSYLAAVREGSFPMDAESYGAGRAETGKAEPHASGGGAKEASR